MNFYNRNCDDSGESDLQHGLTEELPMFDFMEWMNKNCFDGWI